MSGHHHHTPESDKGLKFAITINILLTLAQALGIALFARSISRKPADEINTFGYKRAEVIAALINLTTLIIISVYLLYEAIWRIIEPQVITGWIIVIVASVALIIDMITALITFKMSKNSMNMKAAFLHNLSDGMASLGVILAGILIILYEWFWVDTFITLLIAGFIFWQGLTMLPKTIHLLMDGSPHSLSIDEIKLAAEMISGVENLHHIHIWNLDEHRIALEGHVSVDVSELKEAESIKDQLKEMLRDKFNISHSTLEFEHHLESNCNEG